MTCRPGSSERCESSRQLNCRRLQNTAFNSTSLQLQTSINISNLQRWSLSPSLPNMGKQPPILLHPSEPITSSAIRHTNGVLTIILPAQLRRPQRNRHLLPRLLARRARRFLPQSRRPDISHPLRRQRSNVCRVRRHKTQDVPVQLRAKGSRQLQREPSFCACCYAYCWIELSCCY